MTDKVMCPGCRLEFDPDAQEPPEVVPGSGDDQGEDDQGEDNQGEDDPEDSPPEPIRRRNRFFRGDA